MRIYNKLNCVKIQEKKISFFFVFLFLISCKPKSAQLNLRKETPVKNSKVNKSLKLNKLLWHPTSTYNKIITHNFFKLSYSEKDEQAEWVAYKISRKNYSQQIKRTNDYREDPFVNTKSASPKDYKGSGYDMGHLAPANAMSYNYNSMSESFYLSNISPQKASFNRGIWKSLENKVQYWSSFADSIYVVTGPVLDNPIDQIGENKVNVPRAFYKTLLRFDKGKIRGIAFILPNEKSKKPIYSHVTSIDEIEKLTELDFYYNLNSKWQNKAEANKSIKIWLFKDF